MASNASHRLTMREYRGIAQKGSAEIFIIARFLYRPWTIFVTRLYDSLGVGANMATLHSVLAALGGAAALLWSGPTGFILGAAGLQLYFVLDHVDGELARVEAWKRGRPLSAAGSYLDGWAHVHSLNIAFAATGVGLAIRSDEVIWAAVGIIADNCLGSFPRLLLGTTLWSLYQKDPGVVSRPCFGYALATVTDTERRQLFAGRLSLGRRASMVLSELLLYPGCILVLSVTLLADGMAGMLQGSTFIAVWTKGYLVIFVVMGVAAKLRRTSISVAQLSGIDSPSSP